MKIVILGAAGQLGNALQIVLPNAAALTRREVDITSPERVRESLDALRPTLVINAAAYTRVDRAESEAADAHAVNTFGVGTLASVCADLGATLVHISTNYVFGEEPLRVVPYREADVTGPLNTYGRTKLAGEDLVRTRCSRYFILRTAGLYGQSRSGENFVDVMLRKANAGEVIRVVNDQVVTPTSALDLARAIGQLVGSESYGLYHVTSAGACTWFEFARAIFGLAKMAPCLTAVSSAEFPTAARRPHFSVLDNAKWKDAGFKPLRPWQDALAEYLASHQGCRFT